MFLARKVQKLKASKCCPFIAPADVVLSESDVVQPDIFVVCDEKKITEANIQGAPDLVVEAPLWEVSEVEVTEVPERELGEK